MWPRNDIVMNGPTDCVLNLLASLVHHYRVGSREVSDCPPQMYFRIFIEDLPQISHKQHVLFCMADECRRKRAHIVENWKQSISDLSMSVDLIAFDWMSLT